MFKKLIPFFLALSLSACAQMGSDRPCCKNMQCSPSMTAEQCAKQCAVTPCCCKGMKDGKQCPMKAMMMDNGASDMMQKGKSCCPCCGDVKKMDGGMPSEPAKK